MFQKTHLSAKKVILDIRQEIFAFLKQSDKGSSIHSISLPLLFHFYVLFILCTLLITNWDQKTNLNNYSPVFNYFLLHYKTFYTDECYVPIVNVLE